MDASIVIPTYNRRKLLEKALECLFYQNYPADRYEIIVVDDGSTDGTEEMIKPLLSSCKLRYLRNKQRMGLPKTRNRGIKEAKGKIIIFTDSDVMVTPDFIKQHLSYHKKYKNAIVKGELIQVSSFDQIGKKKKGIFDICFNSFTTANVSVKRSHLIEVGLFDESFLPYGWEDMELGHRLVKKGLKRIKNRNAIGYHYKGKENLFSNSNLTSLYEKEMMRGINGALYYKKHPELRVKLATQYNPLFAFSFIGEWIEKKKSGKKLLEFSRKHKIGWLYRLLLKLIEYYYYLQGFKRANYSKNRNP